MNKHSLIRTIYLYLITAITIIMAILALVHVMKIGLEVLFGVKSYDEIGPRYECQDVLSASHVMGRPAPILKTDESPTPLTPEEKEECLKKAEELSKARAKNERKRDLVWSLSLLIIALPIYFYHWKTIQKDHNA